MKMFTRLILCLLSLMLFQSQLMASPLDEGKSAFSSGDYANAAKLLSKGVKKVKDKSRKARMYVMIGAATIKAGKAGKGKAKFVKALKLDPNVSLPAEVESDKKVAKAFAAAQKKAGTTVSDGGGSSSDKLTKKSRGNADHSAGNIKNYLPFGLNSYMQGKTVSAVVFGGAQAGGLLLYLNRKQAASDADKDAKSVIADAEANDATDKEEFLQFLSDNDAFVKKANSEATMALGLFVGAYALSVVDAILDPFHTSKKSASVDDEGDTRYASMGTQEDSYRPDTSWKFDLGMLPNREKTMFLTLQKDF